MGTVYVSPAGNDTTGTGAIGSPFASPGKAASVAVSGDVISIASGTYLITTTTKNVPEGRVSPASGVIVRGTGATRPVLRAAGTSSFTIITSPNPSENQLIRFIELDGNGASNVYGYASEGGSIKYVSLFDIVFRDLNRAIAETQADTSITRCFATLCRDASTFTTNAQATYINCVAYNNAGSGFGGANGSGRLIRCIAAKNGGSGFQFNNQNGISVNCVAYKNNENGFSSEGGGALGQVLANGIAYGNTLRGFYAESNTINVVEGLATGANIAGSHTPSTPSGIFTSPILLTENPFVNPDMAITSIEDAQAAFALNNNAGGGALLRGAGFPAYLDLGAIQHQDAGGGGSSVRTLIQL